LPEALVELAPARPGDERHDRSEDLTTRLVAVEAIQEELTKKPAAL
jgi:hypothetical protein